MTFTVPSIQLVRLTLHGIWVDAVGVVDGLHLMRASDEGYEHILEHLSSHLADLQDLFVIHLLLTAVVQRYLVGDERETQDPQSAMLGYRHLRNCAHAWEGSRRKRKRDSQLNGSHLCCGTVGDSLIKQTVSGSHLILNEDYCGLVGYTGRRTHTETRNRPV